MQDGTTAWLQAEIDSLKAAGLYNNIRTLDSPMDAWVTIDGRDVNYIHPSNCLILIST